MIQKETYSLENIKRIKDKYNVDPELAQRSIFALGFSNPRQKSPRTRE